MSTSTRITAAAIAALTLRRRSVLAVPALTAMPPGVRARAHGDPARSVAAVQQFNAARQASLQHNGADLSDGAPA